MGASIQSCRKREGAGGSWPSKFLGNEYSTSPWPPNICFYPVLLPLISPIWAQLSVEVTANAGPKSYFAVVQFWSPPLIPNLPNRWRQNMNSVWTDHYQRPLLTVCLYPRGAEGQSKLQQRPLITNLPLCVKFGTKLIGIRINHIF